MTYYLQAMRGFSDFRGRARRAEYWMFALVYLGIYLVAGTLDVVLGTTQLLGAPVLATVVALVHLVPAIALLVRRLHDTGRSGVVVLHRPRPAGRGGAADRVAGGRRRAPSERLG
ncbi:DUF805 domain-containing protein [Pseudonocardia sp. ICBG601]|uniref:DUF805 domain-containing protein n=1 Tax=Pseudonocardia sp. ICBG601 TaxID=2846759 RepID=UPI001CF6BC1C|nr:DUF805 domain-containing protein [Pseudonocardia sp. ICBG601]